MASGCREGKTMKLDQLLWPAATLVSAIIIAAAIVANGVLLRPARYTFYFSETAGPYRVWRGDNVTGEALRAMPKDGVMQELIYLPAGGKISN